MENIQVVHVKPPLTSTIMDQAQVSFKVTLLSKDEENQVRRFAIPQDCSTSLVYLKEKLRSLFQEEPLGSFKLTWQDEDGDAVQVDSDEELMIALHEMKGPVYRFTVNPGSFKTNAKQESTAVPEPQSQEEHVGVTCDGCSGPVIGHRYKCMKCLDYDLCWKCESKGIHPGHNMMRIATPDSVWPRHLFSRLNKMQERAFKRRGCSANSSPEESINANGEIIINANGEASAANAEKPKSAPQPRAWGPFWGGARCGQGQRSSGQPKVYQMPSVYNFGYGTSGFSGMSSTETGPDQALYDIGKAVRAALDPFGVDVDIDVQTSEGLKNVNKNPDEAAKKVAEAKEAKKAAKEAMKEAKKEFKEAKKEAKAASVVKNIEIKVQQDDQDPDEPCEEVEMPKPKEAEKIQDAPKEPVKEVAKEQVDEEWTVLDKSNSASPEPEPAVEAKPEDPKPVDQGATALYPKLDEPEPENLSPKVKIALQAMKQMGFTNEGGWLSALLDKYDGDIGKVLDLLSPAKPFRA